MFSLQTHELSLLLCCALDYLAMVMADHESYFLHLLLYFAVID